MGSKIISGIKKTDSELLFLPLVIIVLGVISTAINPNFLTANNMLAILQQVAVLGILSSAMLMLLVSGMMDLSYGSLIGLCGIALCLFVQGGMNPFLALGLMFLIAIAGGTLNGIIVTSFNVEPLIITIGTGYIFNGIAFLWSGGTFQSLQGELSFIGTGRVGGIPVSIIVLAVVLIATHIVLRKTPFGRRLHIIGGNREVAFLSGLKPKKYLIITFAIGGLICGLAAFVLTSRIGSALAVSGQGNELRALVACIIGGASFKGAKGTVLGTLFGVLLLGVISNAVNIVGLDPFFQTVVLGVIIIIAVIASNLKTSKA